ncbi:unnamed protein product [Polarella glacialis]|uniref:Uncharacterized protein n=1 Tax=Polarella glacialis TaxID=89957 RepID=A0A813FEK5_POLGL|nr:unnamed protein product [Polarella glacialis]
MSKWKLSLRIPIGGKCYLDSMYPYYKKNLLRSSSVKDNACSVLVIYGSTAVGYFSGTSRSPWLTGSATVPSVRSFFGSPWLTDSATVNHVLRMSYPVFPSRARKYSTTAWQPDILDAVKFSLFGLQPQLAKSNGLQNLVIETASTGT